MAQKKRVWFYFWKKGTKKGKVKAAIHWNGRRHIVDDIVCERPTRTKMRKRNPVMVMECMTYNMKIVQFDSRKVAVIPN